MTLYSGFLHMFTYMIQLKQGYVSVLFLNVIFTNIHSLFFKDSEVFADFVRPT